MCTHSHHAGAPTHREIRRILSAPPAFLFAQGIRKVTRKMKIRKLKKLERGENLVDRAAGVREMRPLYRLYP